jgi:hypothetical protein
MSEGQRPNRSAAWNRELEETIREAVATVRFGTVTLVIQDGRVIQLDKSEKIRLA